jgi:hypothetical protein
MLNKDGNWIPVFNFKYQKLYSFIISNDISWQKRRPVLVTNNTIRCLLVVLDGVAVYPRLNGVMRDA